MEVPPCRLVSPVKKRARKRTSLVWNFFIKASCSSCGKTYGAKTGTSTLHGHLAKCKTPTPMLNFDQEGAEKLLTHWLLANNIFSNALDCPFFSNLMKMLCPQFKPPYRTKFMTVLTPQVCEALQKVMHTMLKEIAYFSISFDGWSSNALRGYLGIVLHRIDGD